MIKSINRGDVILTKDRKQYTVEAVRWLNDSLYKLEGVDRNAPSPMRTTVWASDFDKVIKRAPKVMDYELRRECELQEDGVTYKPVERRFENDPNYKTLLRITTDRRYVKIMKEAK